MLDLVSPRVANKVQHDRLSFSVSIATPDKLGMWCDCDISEAV